MSGLSTGSLANQIAVDTLNNYVIHGKKTLKSVSFVVFEFYNKCRA